ncbi:sulfotransferase 1B1-like [Mytilus trossulus]|uniref:sulfotransferase 1B1-like n=1 Tax=Mytilus trossulus TaxID=6551 RepID=UPI0030071C7E
MAEVEKRIGGPFFPFIDYKSITLPPMPPIVKDVHHFMDSLRNFSSRETDVILCSPMKSGTHWVHELVSMLLHRTTEYNSHGELNDCNFECQTDWERLEKMNSPRFFHTHLPMEYLPRKHVENKYKIIYLNRNPKDRAVSQYLFLQGKTGVPRMTWNEFFEKYVVVDTIYGGWFTFTKEFEKAIAENRENILPVTFENLKIATIPTLLEIASFLGISVDDNFIKDIADKCAFENIKKNKIDTTVSIHPEGRSTLWRKGIIGDWENWFTVEQHEMFEKLYQREMEGYDVNFVYNSPKV